MPAKKDTCTIAISVVLLRLIPYLILAASGQVTCMSLHKSSIDRVCGQVSYPLNLNFKPTIASISYNSAKAVASTQCMDF